MNSASAKATSASGARKRAGLRPAIAIDDTRGVRADPARARGAQPSAQASLAEPLGLGARGLGGRAAARPRARSAIERDALTRPPARPGAKAGASVRDAAALRADAGQQERRVRHQLAHAREVLAARSRP